MTIDELCTGETIPASDSDDEERRGEDQLEGPHRECIERVMRQLMAEHGSGPDVVQALAMKFSAANGVYCFDAPMQPLDICIICQSISLFCGWWQVWWMPS